MNRAEKYKSPIFILAIVVGIVLAVTAKSAFVSRPFPKSPTVLEEGMDVGHVFFLLMLVPIVIAKWVMFAVELFKIYWMVILCVLTPICLAWGYYKITG